MVKSWSHQLLINYILTIYVLYIKIGVCAYFVKYLQRIGIQVIASKFESNVHFWRNKAETCGFGPLAVCVFTKNGVDFHQKFYKNGVEFRMTEAEGRRVEKGAKKRARSFFRL